MCSLCDWDDPPEPTELERAERWIADVIKAQTRRAKEAVARQHYQAERALDRVAFRVGLLAHVSIAAAQAGFDEQPRVRADYWRYPTRFEAVPR